MNDSNSCCSGGPRLIFACSGAADVGEITDRAARKMTKEGTGKMFCLAGIGGRIETIMKTTKSASKILALDGCGLDCVKNSLEQAGFSGYTHMRLTDLGLEKGQSPPTDDRIAQVAEKVKELIST